MARYTFRLPDIGEGIAEAEIVAWHVRVGDRVEEDGRLADMMTDKATVEMESPVAGTVLEVAGEVGDRVAIGSALVVLEVEGVADPEEKAAPSASSEWTAEETGDFVPDAPDLAPPSPAVRPELAEGPHFPLPQTSTPEEKSPPPTNPKILASPAVRARARELGVDLSEVRPSEAGRIRHADLDQFIAYNAAGGFAPAGQTRADEQVRVIGLRRRIAENMAAAKRAIPHFTYVEECDVTELEALRATLNDNRGDRPRLTLLPLFIAAMCRALPQFPMLNARYDDGAGVVTRHGAVHLGMATQTPAGLMVPVIRHAERKNLWQLAAEIARLAEAARNGSAKSDELTGSTITVTSLGPLGGIASSPIINRPEVAIIGPNRIIERPMFVPDGLGGERIARRKTMNVSLSCDHRVVDGWDAASFVQALKKLLETPVLLLAN